MLNQNKTNVTVRQTTIKYFNEQENAVKEVTVVGKLNITEAKNFLKDNGYGIYISKEDVKESFDVDTVQLIQLKEIL